MDKVNNQELLKFILDSIEIVQERFEGISSSDDFMYTKEGMTKLDSTSMRLQYL